jgi:hypothetical protein
MALISLTEWAKKHNRDTSTVRQLILRDGLPEAQKIGRNYVIDDSVPYPTDRRIVSGKYVGSREKLEKQ